VCRVFANINTYYESQKKVYNHKKLEKKYFLICFYKNLVTYLIQSGINYQYFHSLFPQPSKELISPENFIPFFIHKFYIINEQLAYKPAPPFKLHPQISLAFFFIPNHTMKVLLHSF
jgi:hypothetical protein